LKTKNPSDNVIPVPEAIVDQWVGLVLDAEKLNEKPSGGVIVEQKIFEKLWESWRGAEKPPRVDFASQLVLVVASRETKYAGLFFNGPNEEGDIKLVTPVHASPPTKGFSYAITVVKRNGIKAVDGRPIPTK
jgi:hypothetical protein